VIDTELFKNIGNEIIPIIFLIFGDIHIFKSINETINEKFSNHVDSIMTSKNTLEILNKGVSKGKALDEIMKMHHIRSKNILLLVMQRMIFLCFNSQIILMSWNMLLNM